MTDATTTDYTYPEIRREASAISWTVNRILKDRFGFPYPQKLFVPTSLLTDVFNLLEWLGGVMHDDWEGEGELTKIIHEAQELGIPEVLKDDHFQKNWEWFVSFLKETGREQNIQFEVREPKVNKSFTNEERRSHFVSFGIEYGYLDLEYYRYFDVKNCRKKTWFERLLKKVG